jgi:hypothetical protein
VQSEDAHWYRTSGMSDAGAACYGAYWGSSAIGRKKKAVSSPGLRFLLTTMPDEYNPLNCKHNRPNGGLLVFLRLCAVSSASNAASRTSHKCQAQVTSGNSRNATCEKWLRVPKTNSKGRVAGSCWVES